MLSPKIVLYQLILRVAWSFLKNIIKITKKYLCNSNIQSHLNKQNTKYFLITFNK